MGVYIKNIAERFVSERKRHNLSQKKVAEFLDVSEKTVKNYEAGRSEIPSTALQKLQEEYGFDAQYILSGESDKQKLIVMENMIKGLSVQSAEIDKLLKNNNKNINKP